ncbi:MAG: DUF167 domain-containing protein [Nitrospirales bacterium]
MIHDSPEGAILTVHVQPNASKTEFAGLHGDALKIRVAAPPVEGAANERLRAFLADRLGLPTRSVHIASGGSSRRKRILLRGMTPDQVRALVEGP